MNELSNHDCELARLAATEAGRSLLAYVGHWQGVAEQAAHDIKLEADRRAECIILERLKAGSPYPILSEECGETGGTIGQADVHWIVDPLDGTANYSRAAPFTAVSIALWKGPQPLYGVVYDFWRDELFYGGHDHGAFLNERPIGVSNVMDPSQAFLSTGFPAHRDFGEAALTPFLRNIQRFKKIRLYGSTALALAYVAAGRVDAHIEEGIMLWDVAAGMALVEGAGGIARMQTLPAPPAHHCIVRAAATAELLHPYDPFTSATRKPI